MYFSIPTKDAARALTAFKYLEEVFGVPVSDKTFIVYSVKIFASSPLPCSAKLYANPLKLLATLVLFLPPTLKLIFNDSRL